jgi:murE/murF fusion protein
LKCSRKYELHHKEKSQPVFWYALMSASHTDAKQLKNLLEGIECKITGDIEKILITGLCSDSRKVRPGNLFAALRGMSVDGHNFLGQAVSSGCSALLVDHGGNEFFAGRDFTPEIPVVEVADTKTAFGNIAAAFYDHPDRQLTVIGITGTNGKTTTTFLVESLLQACGKRTGVIGTVNYRYHDKKDRYIEMEAPFTTPESHTLFGLLREMADQDVTDVVMEVSSHALAQARLTAMAFDIAVFTNLSRDHLDFHSDMDQYFASKKLLFTEYLKPQSRVVIVLDASSSGSATEHDWGQRMQEEIAAVYQGRNDPPAAILTCGTSTSCDVQAQKFTTDIYGIKAEIKTPGGNLSLKSPLVGQHNLKNILCALGIGIASKEGLHCIRQGLEKVKTIPGRLERVEPGNEGKKCPVVFVDYAHTPDALENVLSALRNLNPRRLVCVFGCGGDRDTGKRSLMGAIAGRLSDVVLATSDNPRSESPEVILAQIEEGLAGSGLKKNPARRILTQSDGTGYDIIINRRTAVRTAVFFAKPEDVILISGKGHENYQLSREGRIFFDDRVEAEMHLEAAAGLPFAWRLSWLQQITGGKLFFSGNKALAFKNVSTDSRTLQKGDLFVALKGENFDGSQFVDKAMENGAAGALVNDTFETRAKELSSLPIMLVRDSLFSLGEMAASRRRWDNSLRVVALTGSSGKTTIKEMTGAILSQDHNVLKTEGNLNNLIGLPLTLLRLEPKHEIAVLEMGMNRPGEIARLTEIADPDIACIINVQEAHLEGLGDIWGVARAKNELFAGLKPDGRVAVNLDDEIVTSLAETLSQEKIFFGCNPKAFIRATDIQSRGLNGMAFTLHIGPESRQANIKGLGKHNVTNSLAAAAMAYGLGVKIDEITRGLAAFRPYDKRTCVEELAHNIRVLNDSYNANPASMLAALNTLAELKKGRRAVAVLGDMLELGSKSDEAHATLGRQVHGLHIDYLAAFGSQAENMASNARDRGMTPSAAKSFSSKNELVAWLLELMRDGEIASGDWILIKGSRSMRMEEVLEMLHKNKNNIKAAGN